MQNQDIAKQSRLPACQDTGLCRIFLKVGYKVAVVELLRVQLSGFPGMDIGTGTLRNSLAQAQRGGYLRTYGCGLLEMIGKGNRV